MIYRKPPGRRITGISYPGTGTNGCSASQDWIENATHSWSESGGEESVFAYQSRSICGEFGYSSSFNDDNSDVMISDSAESEEENQ